MPLCGKHPFIRQKPPTDLKPNDEVFYCKITNEGFTDYDEYFARVILCNSLVWTCSLTGKAGLTFQDALNSEEHALQTLASFPSGLRKPLLFLANLTQRSRLSDLCDDVYSFARDRYFVGESVEVTIKSQKKTCTVTAVTSPHSKQSKSPSKGTPNNAAASSGGATASGAASPQKKPPAVPQPVPSDKVKYQVVDPDGKVHTVPPTDVCRKKASFTREKNRIFFRQAVELQNGVLRVKEKTDKKYGLHQLTFADMFTGPAPTFKASPRNKPSAAGTPGSPTKAKKPKQSSPKKEGAAAVVNGKKEPSEKAANAEAAAAAAEVKQLSNEQLAAEAKAAKDREFEELLKLKIAQKEARQKKKMEERRLHAQFLTEWNRQREDLECDDLRELPPLVPLQCALPPERFGDCMVVLEFLSLFAQQLDLKDFFPAGVSFDLLERALTETDVLGPLSDLFQMLLTAVFRTQEEEVEATKGRQPQGEESPVAEEGEGEEERPNKARDSLQAIRKAQRAATTVSQRLQQALGLKLSKVTVDALSLTEVLRLHLASSGSLDVGRKVFSGWYSQAEDPGLWFATEEPQLMARLSKGSIHDLEIGDKVKLLRVLVDQLLSMESFRGIIEENLIKLKQLKQDLRQIRLSLKQQDEPKKKKNQKEGASEAKKEGGAEGAEEDVDDKASDKAPLYIDRNEEGGGSSSSKVNGIVPEALKTPQQRKEELRRREEMERKEQALRKQVEQLQCFYALQPLGEDRCHRRYWQFNTLPGLFVEDSDAHRGACIPGGTPLVRCELPKNPSVTFMEAFLLRNSRKRGDAAGENAALSDKENKEAAAAERKAAGLHAEGKTQKLLCDSNPRVGGGAGRRASIEAPPVMNGIVDPKRELSVVLEKVDSVISEVASGGPHPYGSCSGNAVTCLVHGEAAVSAMPRWWFCRNKEELEALIGALNPRGFRESKLRAALKRDQANLESLVAKCPGRRLNPLAEWPLEEEGEAEVRKSSRLQAGPKPSALAGYPSRLAQVYGFREALLDLEEKLYSGSLGIIKVDRIPWREKLDSLLAAVEAAKKEPAELTKISESLNYESEVKYLSKALLDVSLGIEAKFLQPPLGESDELKKKRKAAELARQLRIDDGEDVPEEPPAKASLLDSWRESVGRSRTVAQLFLHLSSLERSVAWDRSVLKAYCRICRRRRDPERMLLCDGCDRGHHLYCLKPPLEEIPKGDWYCIVCRPKAKPASPAKRKYIEEEDDDQEEDGEEEEEENNENDSGDEQEEDEDQEETEATEETEDESTDGNEDACYMCGKGGTLVCCDSCPLVYHMECARPPLRRLPRGSWICHKCTALKQHSTGATSTSRAGKGSRTRSQSAAAESKRYIERRQQKAESKKQQQPQSSDPYRPPRISFKRARVNWDETSSLSEEGLPSRTSSRRSSQDLPLDFKACDEILQSLVHDEHSWPFHCAVSRRDVPDYYDVIRRPMDLGKIRGKLSSMEYRTTKEFVADIYLIFQNCSVYNRPGSPEHSAGVSLLGTFERLLAHHGLGEFPHAPCFEDSPKRTPQRASKRQCCDSDSEEHPAGGSKRAATSKSSKASTSARNSGGSNKRHTR